MIQQYNFFETLRLSDPGDVCPILKSSSECPPWSPSWCVRVSDGCRPRRILSRPEQWDASILSHSHPGITRMDDKAVTPVIPSIIYIYIFHPIQINTTILICSILKDRRTRASKWTEALFILQPDLSSAVRY